MPVEDARAPSTAALQPPALKSASPPPPTPPRPHARPRLPSCDLDEAGDDDGVWSTLAGAGLVAAAGAPRRRPAVVPVPHVRQASTWDCGLACVLMVLRAAGAPPTLSLNALKHDVGTESVWTIDLAHSLARRGVPVTLTTTTVGRPNPAYAGEAFYGATLAADAPRVAALFLGAAAAGVAVERRSLTSACVASFLASGDGVVVVLVDRRALARPASPSARVRRWRACEASRPRADVRAAR